MVQTFDQLFSQYHVFFKSETNTKLLVPSNKLMEKLYTKDDYSKYLAQFLSQENLKTYIETLSPSQNQLLKYVLQYIYASSSVVNAIFGKKYMTESASSWDNRSCKISGALNIFCDTYKAKSEEKDRYGYPEYTYYLYIKDLYEPLFRDILLTQPNLTACSKEHLEDFPDASQLLRYTNEENLMTQITIFDSLYDSGQVDTSRDILLATQVKKIAQIISAKEFFDNTKNNFLKARAATMLVNALLNNLLESKHKSYQTADIGKKIRHLFNTIPLDIIWLFKVILKDYTGLTTHFDYSDSKMSLCLTINNLLIQLKDMKWVDVDTCTSWILYETKKNRNSAFLVSPYTIERYNLKNKYNDKNITIGNGIEQITIPFIQGYLFLMAALGFVEIAYSEPNEDDAAWSSKLKYVRLTSLGAYALQLTDSLTTIQNESKESFSLDEERLYIKIIDSNTPYLPIINKLALKISHNLYKVSYESFLTDCRNKKDIENNINLFESYISKEKPAIWKEFFKSLEDRCNPMKGLNTQYKIMKIESKDKDLLQLLTTDARIREHTIRAEQYIILIENDFVDRFKLILKQHGFLV